MSGDLRSLKARLNETLVEIKRFEDRIERMRKFTKRTPALEKEYERLNSRLRELRKFRSELVIAIEDKRVEVAYLIKQKQNLLIEIDLLLKQVVI